MRIWVAFVAGLVAAFAVALAMQRQPRPRRRAWGFPAVLVAFFGVAAVALAIARA